MKNILALVDLSPLSAKVVDQANAIASKIGAKLTLCHILSSQSQNAEAESAMEPLLEAARRDGVEAEAVIQPGELFAASVDLVRERRPELVVAGTHGMVSVQQGYFGSAIHKLVKEIPGSTLVLSEGSAVVKGGYPKILLPVAPHAHFLAKAKASINLLADGGHLVLLAIVQDGSGLDAKVASNLSATKAMLEERGVKWEYLEESAEKHAVGYAAQTMRIMSRDGIQLVSIMAHVSKWNMHFGKIDKETLLLNEQGIQVLCTNDPE